MATPPAAARLTPEEMKQLMGVVRWHLREFFSFEEWEDLLQIGYLGMLKGMALAESKPGVALTTLCTRSARWEVMNHLRSAGNPHRQQTRHGLPLPELVSLSVVGEELLEPPVENIAQQVVEREAQGAVWAAFTDFLAADPLTAEIIERTVLDDELDVDVALDMGICPDTLSKYRAQALAAFRARYPEGWEDE